MFRIACFVSVLLTGLANAIEPTAVTAFPDLTYATLGDDKLKLDLVVPSRWSAPVAEGSLAFKEF